MKLKYIDHIVLIVKDIKRTYEFYKIFLGESSGEPAEEQVWWQVGDTKIFFGLPFGEAEKYDKDKTGFNHLAFGIRSIEELKELEQVLNNGGIKHSGIRIDKYSQKEFIWFDDPDNYRIEFYYRPNEI